MATLLDAYTRAQIYLEGVKLDQGRAFSKVNAELADVTKAVFATLEVDTLGGASKKVFLALIKRLRLALTHVMDKYTSGLLDVCKALMSIETKFAAAIMEADTGVPLDEQEKKRDFIPLFGWLSVKDEDTLWKQLSGEVIPATGLKLTDQVKNISVSVIGSIVNRVAQAYANNETPKEALASIVGTDNLFNRDGVLGRIVGAIGSIINTIIQSVSTHAQSAINSIYTGRYQWISVIDSRTTEICAERDGNIYEYPNDPIPPAHMNCRSRTIPVTADDPTPFDELPSSLSEWLRTQPAEVQHDIGAVANTGRYIARRPLTLEEFDARLPNILL